MARRIDPIALLRKRCAKPSSASQVARDIGVKPPYIQDVLSGDRRPSDKVLAYLGIERVVKVVYRWRGV